MSKTRGVLSRSVAIAILATGCGRGADTMDAGASDTGLDAGVVDAGCGGSTSNCCLGETVCGDVCANLQTAWDHCGSCATHCRFGEACVNGLCCPVGQSRCGAQCEDLQNDPANCGSCGYACQLGWSCNSGHCLTAVAENQYDLLGLAIDPWSVYWSVNNPGFFAGQILKADIAGGTPHPIATSLDQPWDIAVDDSGVYFANGYHGLSKVGVNGGTITLFNVANGQIALGPTDVFVTQSNGSPTGILGKIPKTGGSEVILASNQRDPYVLTLDETNIYWANRLRVGTELPTIMKMPLSGGTPVILATSPATAEAIAVDGMSVYWITNECAYDSVYKVPIAGGPVVELQGNILCGGGLTVGPKGVYWSDNANNFIGLTPIDGLSPGVTFATGQWDPTHLALDSKYLYWNARGHFVNMGSVMMAEW